METRDKLFTEEQYVKQLAKYTDRIERFNSIIEQSERNRKEPVNPDFYGRLFDCKVNYIVTMWREIRMYKIQLYLNNQCFRKMLDSVWLLCSDVMAAFDRYHVGV